MDSVEGKTAVITGGDFSLGSYLTTLLVFASFLAVLGVGQGAVVLAGGLDLSIAWSITFPAIVVTTYASGSNADAVWAMPLALGIGAMIGLVNGVLVVGARLSPIIATLATASILEGTALVFSDGAPTGAAPPMLAWFVNGRLLGLPPVVYFLAVFVILATLLLDRSAFGRRLHAVGMNAWVAKLSGVRTGAVIIAAFSNHRAPDGQYPAVIQRTAELVLERLAAIPGQLDNATRDEDPTIGKD